MSEIGEYTIILFENNISDLKEILEISLNIIFFHRNLSNINYIDAQSKFTNITYVKLKNENLSNEISNIINELEVNLKKDKLYGYQLTLSFFEIKEKNKNMENPWEKWNFLLIKSKNEEDKEKKNEIKDNETDSDIDKENKVREYIFKIIEKLNDKGNYMPNVNLDDKNLKDETFLHNFKTEKIENKEKYLSLFNHYLKKNQENIIVINQFIFYNRNTIYIMYLY